MSTVVSGKDIAAKILDRSRATIGKHNLRPVLAVVLVGQDKASETYVKRKQEAAESIGVRFLLHKFPNTISNQELADEIVRIQKEELSGLIVQMPLPPSINKQFVLNQLNPEIDVDFLSWNSLGKLVVGENSLVPPAPGAILEILKYHKISLTAKHIVLVGQGDLIGKPLANILMHLPVTVTTCNKETKNLAHFTQQADILITGAGRSNLIRGKMIKPKAVVIDAGVSFKSGKLTGDINFREVAKVASLVTPTPGGVGPVTVAKLLENTVLNALRMRNK
jgi:methylenetetrahydrofolate dehydrogenase (NADP+) / methenyltetrahydrofolate cyclohydrolase